MTRVVLRLVALVDLMALIGCTCAGRPPSDRRVHAIASDGDTTCALASDGELSCWGGRREGELSLAVGISRVQTRSTASRILRASLERPCVELEDGAACCYDSLGGAEIACTDRGPYAPPRWAVTWAGYGCRLDSQRALLCLQLDVRDSARVRIAPGGEIAELGAAELIRVRLASGRVSYGYSIGGTLRWEYSPTGVAPGTRTLVGEPGLSECCLDEAGAVRCRMGQVPSAPDVVTLTQHVVQLDSEGTVGIARLEDGTVAWWLEPSHVQFVNLTGVVAISAGLAHVCALDEAARVWCWGANHMNQLNDMLRSYHEQPVLVSLPQAR